MASAKDTAVDEGPVLPEKETLGSFFFNRKEGTVLGRTGLSWAKITLFYCIYYGCLAGWFAGLLHGFYSTLDDIAPAHYGEDSLLLNNPGLGIRPVPIADLTLIRFTAGVSSSYRPYTQHLKAFFDTYEEAPGAVPCKDGTNMTDTDGAPCRVEILDLLQQIDCTFDNDFGYKEGEPCVVVKINKLYGFVPEPYPSLQAIEDDVEQSSDPNNKKSLYRDTMPRYISYGPGNVGISCDGHNQLDRIHIEDVLYAPNDGIAEKFFPYMNQRGYRSPVVVFKFKGVARRELVQVTCKAWALNIDNSDGQQKRGSVHFELLID